METSSPASLSSFDPATNLHSQPIEEPTLPPSDSNSDDFEALHLLQHELLQAKTRAAVVIQHGTRLETLNSDEVFNPETPTKPKVSAVPPQRSPVVARPARMPLSSSPVLYPASSSPAVPRQKRKLFRSIEDHSPNKRKKLVGLFMGIDENKENEDENINGYEASSIKKPVVVAEKPSERDVFRVASASHSPDRSHSPSMPPLPQWTNPKTPPSTVSLKSSTGKTVSIPVRTTSAALSYEQMIAQRSVTAAGRAKKAYYGIDIHQLVDDAAHQDVIDRAAAEATRRDETVQSVEAIPSKLVKPLKANPQNQMWTEKYRARKFTDLVGDERTHRSVLRWLKSWDPVVFPGSAKPKARKACGEDESEGRTQHRKILMLTGQPGLGKTTLAHVCAKQAGYEVLEINASDDRSAQVVKGRIKDALGTETVRGVKEQNKARKAGRPVCVLVDEVDGVVTGSGGSGEGGFMKALVDLVHLDQKNASQAGSQQAQSRSKKGSDSRFKLLRPLILVCNDAYAPSLRPLRNSSVAELVHCRKPPLDKVITRLKYVFENEGIPCDSDAVRRLCESSWGMASRKQGGANRQGAGEGDIRSVLVQGEWVAHKLRASTKTPSKIHLTRKWMETNGMSGNGQADSGSHGLGRGGTREVVERVFLEGAGLPSLPAKVSTEDARLLAESKKNGSGVADARKRAAVNLLREMADTCGEYDRLMSDCFATYPTQVYQDDTMLSKPNAGYDWLCFHDRLSSRVFGGQEWELNPYLSSSVCAFHHLFSGTENRREQAWEDKNHKEDEAVNDHPFSGPKADFAAHEAEKQTKAVLTEFQASFSAPLLRLFRSMEAIAAELVPSVANMLAPEVKPIVVGGSGGGASVASVRKQSEKECVQTAVRVMSGLNVKFEKARVEIEGGGAHSNAGFVYRMEP